MPKFIVLDNIRAQISVFKQTNWLNRLHNGNIKEKGLQIVLLSETETAAFPLDFYIVIESYNIIGSFM